MTFVNILLFLRSGIVFDTGNFRENCGFLLFMLSIDDDKNEDLKLKMICFIYSEILEKSVIT